MSNQQNGFVVFTATSEVSKSMPKVFKTGVTYVVQRATSVVSPPSIGGPVKQKKGPTSSSKPNKAQKTAPVKSPSKTESPSGGRPSGSKQSKFRPDIVIQFVKDNQGCNMTQIEAATKMDQNSIRKTLGDARDAGQIRTEGQRRGLRYFSSTGSSGSTAVVTAAVSSDEPQDSSSKTW